MDFISKYLWDSSAEFSQFEKGTINLRINNTLCTVPADLPPSTRLVDYLRDHLHHKGTKYMCREAGCGACIVAVKRFNSITQKYEFLAVNSCIVPLFLCSSWSIITVEGIGSTKSGMHTIQSTLAKYSGTQCGYCTPGFVMNMFSLVNGKEKLSMAEIEDSFSGNICRCTGYRPILDAFKSLADDSSEDLKKACIDIEDIRPTGMKMCPKTTRMCTGTCDEEDWDFLVADKSFFVPLSNNSIWIRVTRVSEIYEIFKTLNNSQKYMLVGGYTSDGVYRIPDDLDLYIDINGVDELHGYTIENQNLVVGANTTLNGLIDILTTVASENPQQFSYLHQLVTHMNLVANLPVRNIGTIAGNLMLKHTHPEFPSDMFVLLEACRATLTIGNERGIVDDYWLSSFFVLNMRKLVIIKVNFPPHDSDQYAFRSYKIMQRAQNNQAYVNAAFAFCLDRTKRYCIRGRPQIVYGHIKPNFIHAERTEMYLLGKELLDKSIIREACRILSNELQPNTDPATAASPEYRRSLGINLFYKCILSLLSSNVAPKYRSGGSTIERPLSSGKQDYQLNKSFWPVGRPIPKLEAFIQCTGEAEYVNDIPISMTDLYAAVVLSRIGPAKLVNVDTSSIKNERGFVAFLSAKDIPGKNTIVEGYQTEDVEELFVSENIRYTGQVVGAVIATTQVIANKLAGKVIVHVSQVKKAIIDMEAIIQSGDTSRIITTAEKTATKKKGDVEYKLNGYFRIGSQYHFTMETQTCLCVPTEDGMNVYASTQWATIIQQNVSAVLKIPMNSVNVNVRRCGGGYGAKLGRSTVVAGVCAVAAQVLRKPVRMVMQLESNMRGIGKRNAVYAKYEVAVNKRGEIQTLSLKMYHNTGRYANESTSANGRAMNYGLALYQSDTFNWTDHDVKTDIPPNTWCRAPGSCESIAVNEYIMEHIAHVTKLDPITVRLNNLTEENSSFIKPMLADLKTQSNFDRRKKEVETFNQANRWKKRGLSVTFMNFAYEVIFKYHVVISIYAPDGTVHVSHGGVEIGQGINTKVAQAVCYKFGIDLKFVKIKSTDTFTAPNDNATADSNASDAVTKGTLDCCDILLKRLEPTKKKYPKLSWPELILKANENNVDLLAESMYSPTSNPLKYNIYGICASEVEVDLLTGQCQVRRVDLLEDVGDSMSPYVDIGQAEGAFMMGLGYWLNEKLKYDKDTGELLTDRTWTYTPPMAKDIPVDFRVYFRRNAPNPLGVLRSKATGEPPLCLSFSIPLAVRNALVAGRKDTLNKDKWLDINLPYTPENILLSSSTTPDQFDI